MTIVNISNTADVRSARYRKLDTKGGTLLNQLNPLTIATSIEELQLKGVPLEDSTVSSVRHIAEVVERNCAANMSEKQFRSLEDFKAGLLGDSHRFYQSLEQYYMG